MPQYPSLNPAEQVIALSLWVQPNQTIEQLAANTGTQTLKYLRRTARTLVLGGIIAYNAETKTYSPVMGND